MGMLKNDYLVKEKGRWKTKLDEKSMTRQEFKKECDVNVVLDRYLKTGQLPYSAGTGVYSNVSEVPSYQEALQFVIDAQNDFAKLNPHVKNRFGNNPQNLIEFLQNEDNYDEALKLGLVRPPHQGSDSTNKAPRGPKGQEKPKAETSPGKADDKPKEKE